MRFLGKKGTYKFLASGWIIQEEDLIDVYGTHCLDSVVTYEELLTKDVASEDARGVLPTNILTSIFFSVSMKTLMHMYEQRMCCQAQEDWIWIMVDIKCLLAQAYGTQFSELLTSPFQRGEPCGYGASFDRKCRWKS
jgi:hypothetical protein